MFDMISRLLDYEISAPLQRNLYWGSSTTLESAMYEPAPRTVALPPPVANVIQRGSWKTGSTSSTSSKCFFFFYWPQFFFSPTFWLNGEMGSEN